VAVDKKLSFSTSLLCAVARWVWGIFCIISTLRLCVPEARFYPAWRQLRRQMPVVLACPFKVDISRSRIARRAFHTERPRYRYAAPDTASRTKLITACNSWAYDFLLRGQRCIHLVAEAQ